MNKLLEGSEVKTDERQTKIDQKSSLENIFPNITYVRLLIIQPNNS